jgi:hypothetical protein
VRSETPDNISCFRFDDGCISVKVREGHRFDLLERGFQSATERRFLTPPLAKRQRPATEEEKTYLE